jgi:hypothetical protein
MFTIVAFGFSNRVYYQLIVFGDPSKRFIGNQPLIKKWSEKLVNFPYI